MPVLSSVYPLVKDDVPQVSCCELIHRPHVACRTPFLLEYLDPPTLMLAKMPGSLFDAGMLSAGITMNSLDN